MESSRIGLSIANLYILYNYLLNGETRIRTEDGGIFTAVPSRAWLPHQKWVRGLSLIGWPFHSLRFPRRALEALADQR